MEHLHVEIRDGAMLHLVKCGQGPPIMLIHGWPEFSLTWFPVMQRLSDRFQLFAPDLRGHGQSDKPSGTFGPDDQAADLISLMDQLGLVKIGLVGHDVGGAVMQKLARLAPDRFVGLFFFDFMYPGIGDRMGSPDLLLQTWYQTFHVTDLAIQLLSASPENVRIYITHFLRHWAHHKDAFDDVLDQFVANFQRPGNLQGGFAHYRASFPSKIAMFKNQTPELPPIELPTCVRWAEHDPLFDYAWTDKLSETFRNLDLAMFKDVGHFPHREDPERAAHEIGKFYVNLLRVGLESTTVS